MFYTRSISRQSDGSLYKELSCRQKNVELQKKPHANDLKMHRCENDALQHDTAWKKLRNPYSQSGGRAVEPLRPAPGCGRQGPSHTAAGYSLASAIEGITEMLDLIRRLK